MMWRGRHSMLNNRGWMESNIKQQTNKTILRQGFSEWKVVHWKTVESPTYRKKEPTNEDCSQTHVLTSVNLCNLKKMMNGKEKLRSRRSPHELQSTKSTNTYLCLANREEEWMVMAAATIYFLARNQIRLWRIPKIIGFNKFRMIIFFQIGIKMSLSPIPSIWMEDEILEMEYKRGYEIPF